MSLNLKSETIWISIVFLSVAIAFSGSLRGEFVYDDRRQIVANPMIQRPELYRKALTSDVWAFKGDGTASASNYWRPVFTAWCILNFLLFGLDAFGWHIANLFLHAAVCILAYMLLRRWNVSQMIAIAIAVVFAVHPVHTESVAWISGSPDILLSFFLLLAILFADKASADRGNRNLNIAIAVIFYTLALGAKEVAVFCAPVLVLVSRPREVPEATGQVSLSPVSLTFVAAAVIYFILRWRIIGSVKHAVPDSPDLYHALLSVPAVFLFYVRQIVWPAWLSPNYPIRPVESVDLWNFVIPSVIALSLLATLFVISRRTFVRKVGLLLFVLPLAPAFLIAAFPSDQIVHDRYLYLPLLGSLMVVVTWFGDLLETRVGRGKGELIVLGVCSAAAVVLCLQTITYRRAWLNEISLWRHAVTIDSSSASNWLQLGAELAAQNDLEASADAFGRSIAIKQSPLAVMGQSRVAMARGDTSRAIGDLERVIGVPTDSIDAYTLYQCYETLAVAYQQQKDYPTAERRLLEARDKLPIYRAALTEKLAVMLYMQGRKSEALTELEGSRVQAHREMLPTSRLVIFRLGMLYSELGRRTDARSAFEEYLKLTANDAVVSEERQQAEQMLRSLK